MVVIAMFCMMSISAIAATNITIELPENQVWTAGIPLTRSGAYNYVTVNVGSVYPKNSPNDNYKKLQARLTNNNGYVVSADNYVVIEEGTGNKNINLKDGFANTNPVNLQFRGNSSAGAMATVSYYAN